MRAVIAMIALAMLAACGADGEPVRPSMNAGVAVTPGGVHPSVSLGTKVGPVNLILGL